ncbi:hypothetical protein J4Q44_G00367330 [Coregonus suidteri]|uniref:Uncharacterized protein n=1 Tax=Coregonus suidteri TaxID=861788 RepID=A0AAN8KKN5_9TELE
MRVVDVNRLYSMERDAAERTMGSRSMAGLCLVLGCPSVGAPAATLTSLKQNPTRAAVTTDRLRGSRVTGCQQLRRNMIFFFEVLAYLLRRLVHGSGATALRLVQSYSDSDEETATTLPWTPSPTFRSWTGVKSGPYPRGHGLIRPEGQAKLHPRADGEGTRPVSRLQSFLTESAVAFAHISCPIMWHTRTHTSRKYSVVCTVTMATCSSQPAKTRTSVCMTPVGGALT